MAAKCKRAGAVAGEIAALVGADGLVFHLTTIYMPPPLAGALIICLHAHLEVCCASLDLFTYVFKTISKK